MASFLTLDDVQLTGRTVLVRVDVNSPLNPVTGEFLDDARLQAVLPTLRRLADAKVVLLAHQSRPGKKDFTSMERHAILLGRLLGREIRFVPDVCGEAALSSIHGMHQGEMIFLDNVRGHQEEIGRHDSTPEGLAESEIVRELSQVADAYVCDAFAAAHRNSPTLSGFGAALPCIAGVLMQRELEVLGSIIEDPQRPQTIILGGVKVDDSLDIAQNLLQRDAVDTFVPVGAVGNLMLMAAGHNLGTVNSGFLEKALGAAFGPTLELAKTLLADHAERILLPIDLGVERDGQRVPISVEDLPTTAPIYDIGIETLMLIRPKIMQVGCVLWNGPASYFEKPEFAFGTVEILNSCCESPARVIIGGGHTGAIVSQRGVAHLVDHNSTGGGSCLTFLAGKRMPAVEALQRSHELFRPDLSRR